MPKRIKLLINPSGLGDEVKYNIYRLNNAASVNDFQDAPCIGIVDEVLCKKKSVSKIGKILIQSEDSPYVFKVDEYFEIDPLPVLYIDDVIINNSLVYLYPEKRCIEFAEIVEVGPETSKIIKMDYTQKVSEIKDSIEVQVGLEYNEDISTVPAGIKLDSPNINWDYDNKKIVAECVIDEDGENYYYLIELVDKEGNKKKSINYKSININANLSDLEFILEYSNDDKVTWIEVNNSNENIKEISDLNKITKESWGEVLVSSDTTSGIKLTIENPWNNWESKYKKSLWYRFVCKDTEGAGEKIGDSFNCDVYFKPKSIKVRRKEDNGIASSYDGYDGIDVYTSISEDETIDSIEVIDASALLNKTYGYTIYVVDENDVISQPTYIVVET